MPQLLSSRSDDSSSGSSSDGCASQCGGTRPSPTSSTCGDDAAARISSGPAAAAVAAGHADAEAGSSPNGNSRSSSSSSSPSGRGSVGGPDTAADSDDPDMHLDLFARLGLKDRSISPSRAKLQLLQALAGKAPKRQPCKPASHPPGGQEAAAAATGPPAPTLSISALRRVARPLQRQVRGPLAAAAAPAARGKTADALTWERIEQLSKPKQAQSDCAASPAATCPAAFHAGGGGQAAGARGARAWHPAGPGGSVFGRQPRAVDSRLADAHRELGLVHLQRRQASTEGQGCSTSPAAASVPQARQQAEQHQERRASLSRAAAGQQASRRCQEAGGAADEAPAETQLCLREVVLQQAAAGGGSDAPLGSSQSGGGLVAPAAGSAGSISPCEVDSRAAVAPQAEQMSTADQRQTQAASRQQQLAVPAPPVPLPAVRAAVPTAACSELPAPLAGFDLRGRRPSGSPGPLAGFDMSGSCPSGSPGFDMSSGRLSGSPGPLASPRMDVVMSYANGYM